jgi:hypothetical protein
MGCGNRVWDAQYSGRQLLFQCITDLEGLLSAPLCFPSRHITTPFPVVIFENAHQKKKKKKEGGREK